MRKYFLGLILTLTLVSSVSFAQTTPPVATSSFVPSSSEVYTGNGEIFNTDTGLKDYTGDNNLSRIQNGAADIEHGGAYRVRNLVAIVIAFVEKMMVPIAIIFLMWAAISLLLSRGDEAAFQKRIRQIVWTGAGFAIFIFSYAIVDRMFFGWQGEIFDGGSNFGFFGESAVNEVIGIINFLSAFAVAVGVAFLTFGAVRLILLGEKEEEQTRIKRQIIFTIIGILLISFANIIARIFFGGDANGTLSIDSTTLIRFIISWANILLGFVSLGAVIALIFAGVQMILHFGNEELVNKSKKIIMYAVIALVLAFSAFTIVRVFVTPGIYGESLLDSDTNQLQPFDRVTPTP